MLQLHDKNKRKIAGLVNYENLCIESVLSTGYKTLSFSYPKSSKYYEEIVEEGYIRTKKDEFVIKSRDICEDYTKFECILNLETLEANIFDRFESVEQTITNSLNLAIVGTGWTVKDNTLKKKRTVRCTNKNALEIVQEIKKTYRVDIVFNTLSKQIEIHEHLGEDKGTYFIDSLNLTALQVQSDSYKFATRIIAEGKDKLTFADINDGKNYVENYQYSKKVKTLYWKDERYTVKESLLEDAKAKLKEISKPFTSYNASVLNLAELNPKYKNILDYRLGDTITLISRNNKVKDKQRIVKTLEYPEDHSRDTVELANAILKFEYIQQENQETTDTVNNITSDNGTLDSNAIEDNSIEIKKIDNFEANVLKVTKLDVINANIENLHANKADIQDLNAVKATVGQLEATKANITQLNATNAEISKLDTLKANIVDLNSATAKIGVLEAKTTSIDNLVSQKASVNDLKALNATISEALIKKATIAQLEALETKTNNLIADKANIKDLNVINANINSLKTYTADIKTLLNGNLSSENIQTKGITSDKLVIANGFIKDVMIDSINVNKLNAGVLTTDKFNIRSRDGNLIIKDNTIQIKDSSKVRVQVGKDASGDYSLYVWDKLGNLMFNALGITKDAIKDKIIRNDMVSDDAAIEGKKLNIESVIREVNNGKSNLKASKIDIDTKGQTLDIAFSNLVTENGKNKEEIVSLITKLNIQQGQINASIENSKILEGKQKTLEDNYNRTVVTVDSLKNTIGSHKTLIDSATGKITSVEVKANTLEKNLSGLTQTVTDTKKVIENNKTVLESKNAELKANIDKISSSLSSVSSTVDKNNKTLVSKTNTLEQNLSGLSQTVANNKTVIDGKITSVEGETHELKVGLGGLTSKLDTLKITTDGINKTVSNQGSVINQLKDSIKLKVDSSTFTQSTQTINSSINKAKEDAVNTAKANTTNAISDLKIGGRNLAQLTIPKEYTAFTGKENDCQMPYEILLNTLNVGDTVTISFVFSYENLVTVQGRNDYFIRIQGSGDVVGWYDGAFPSLDISKRIQWGNGHAGSFKVVYNAPITSNVKKNTKWYSNFRMDCIKSGKVSVKEFMVEYGTKESAYTPAPEDVQAYADSKKNEAIKVAENLALEKSNLAKKYAEDVAVAKSELAKQQAIASADGKISAEEKKRIQQAQENLNTAISKADKAKQDAINEANRLAELKKQEAINSANSHADSKANEALNNAKAFVNAEITNVNTHLNKNTSEINILKGKIESKVSQSDIDKSIQNIKFNDVNMILNSGEFKNTDHWSCTNGSNNLTIENRILKFKFTNYASWGCYISNNSLLNKPLDISKDYTIICKLKASRNQGIGFNICDGNANNYVYSKDLSITTEWKIFKFTFKPASLGNERQFRFITSNLGYDFDLYIEFVKMVEGATSSDSWSMAPDYVLDNIKTVTDKITTVESKLTQENNSIKASVQDLNSTTQSITTNVSNINRDLTSKINSNLDTAKSFAMDIAIAKANLAKEQAIASADGKITAEEQKRIQQAQDNLNTAISKATEAETKAKSYADVKKQEAINSANNNTTNVINNLQIGDRNLAFKTDSESVQVGNNSINQTNFMYRLNTKELRGKEVTISFEWEVEGNNISGSFYTQLSNSPWNSFSDTIQVSNSNKKGKVIKTVKMPYEIQADGIMCRKDNFIGTLKIRKLKIVIGNKIGDWSPAPEDLKAYSDEVAKAKADLAKTEAIANSDGKITDEERKRIQQAQENLNTAIARADKAKQDAINAASTDATNKANNALNSAKAYTNAEITTVNSKVHNVESNINILKNKIESKVSQSDIDKSIANIQLGERNLLRNTGLCFNAKNWYFDHPGIGRSENVDPNLALNNHSIYFNVNGIKNDSWRACNPDGVSCIGGEVFSASVMLMIPSIDNRLDDGDNIGALEIQFWDNSGNRIQTQTTTFRKGTIITDKWYKIACENRVAPPNAVNVNARVWIKRNGRFWVGNLKLVKGRTVGDWTPAPEDTNQLVADSIKVVDTKISDVSSKITQLKDSVTIDINSINSKTQSIETTLGSKASKQEVTEVNNRVATIKASLDSITQRVSSTESKTQTLESNINGKASKQEVNNVSSKVASVETSLNGITQRVSSTESNINKTNDRINSLASKEEVAQLKITTNSISTEVSKKVNSNELISKINQSAETVQINASKINLQGYVTVGELGSSNVTTINNAHITSGTIEGRTMIALNGIGKQNGVLTVNNGESYLEYFRCREAWMMSPYANGWRVPLIHSKFGVKDSETASDMIDEISFYRGVDGRNYLQITNTKTGRVEYIELYRSAFDTVTILNRLDRIDAKLARL